MESGGGAAHLGLAVYDPADEEVLLLLPVLSKMRKDVALSKKEVESMLQPMAKAYSIRIEAEQKMGEKVYSLFCRDCSRLSSMLLKPAVDAVPLPLVDFSLLEEEGTLATGWLLLVISFTQSRGLFFEVPFPF